MQLIKEIHEKDLDIKIKSETGILKLRKAARALIFKDNKIAILKANKLNIHKLPGGGIEEGETIEEGLGREILEETGCRIEKICELGSTIEHRDSINMRQVSYVYTALVSEIVTQPAYTEKEINEGFNLFWLIVEDVIRIMKNEDKPLTYAAKFIHYRDLAILEYYNSHFK